MSDTDRINARLQEALRMKESVLRNANAEGLASGNFDVRAMMQRVPIAKIIDQIQQLENHILPRIAEKKGKDSEDFTMWAGVVNSLRWAIWLNDRVNQLELAAAMRNNLTQFYMSLNGKLERELMKYTTMEQFLQTDTMNDYMAAAAKAAESKLS